MKIVFKKRKKDFEKDPFKLINNGVLGKTMEGVGQYKDIKLVTTERRRNYLVSEPNYHTPNCFSGNILATEMKKNVDIMNKPVYLRL